MNTINNDECTRTAARLPGVRLRVTPLKGLTAGVSLGLRF
jgi:hypothetical protein